MKIVRRVVGCLSLLVAVVATVGEFVTEGKVDTSTMILVAVFFVIGIISLIPNAWGWIMAFMSCCGLLIVIRIVIGIFAGLLVYSFVSGFLNYFENFTWTVMNVIEMIFNGIIVLISAYIAILFLGGESVCDEEAHVSLGERFKKARCADCGGKAKAADRIALAEGQYLCRDCFNALPRILANFIDDDCTVREYQAFKEYKAYSDAELRPVFRDTYSYHRLHLDEEHSLFYLEDPHSEKVVYFRFSDVIQYGFDFRSDGGVTAFDTKVYGAAFAVVVVKCIQGFDSLVCAWDIADNVSTEAVHGAYKNPWKLTEMEKHFGQALEKAYGDTYRGTDPGSDNTGNPGGAGGSGGSGGPGRSGPTAGWIPQDVLDAAKFFFIDDLDGLTMEKLRQTRNSWIKKFHPDTGTEEDTKVAQKINENYDALKAYIEQRDK